MSLLKIRSQLRVGSAASLPVLFGLPIGRQNSGPAEVTRGWDLKADNVSLRAAGRSWRLVKHFLRWVNARRWPRRCLRWRGPAGQPSPAQPSLPLHVPQHKLCAIPLQPRLCWLQRGGDLGRGKAKGRGRLGTAWSLIPRHLRGMEWLETHSC